MREKRHSVMAFWTATALLLVVFSTSATAAEMDPLRPPAIETDNVPIVPSELVDRLRQYQEVRSASFRGWSPDGRGILVRTRFGNTSQLHRIYRPGGRREQLTFFAEPVDGEFIPQAEDGALVLSMSRGGDENYQVYLFEPATGRATLLTDGRSRNLRGPIRDDGRKMVIASNRRNGRDTDLYIADPRRAGSMEMIFQTDGEYWYAADWSPQGDRLLINRYVSINETYPAILHLADGQRRSLAVAGVKAAYGPMAFSHDGRSVFLASDAQGEFRQLYRVAVENGAAKLGSPLTAGIEWDVEELEIEPRTGLVAFTVNENGASALYLLQDGLQPGEKRRLFAQSATDAQGDATRRSAVTLTKDAPVRIDVPLGIIGSLEFSSNGRALGFTLSRPDAPADAYSLQLDDGRLIRWSFSEVGGLNPQTFVTPQRIRYRSFDGREIPAYVFRPRSASRDKPAPVVINIHGGPEGQYRPYFSGFDQFLLNELGIAVIRPNVRGSAGYGKTYLLLDNAEKREDSVRDIGALLDWIATQPDLDASRVAVLGGSYGGYMVLASLVHFGERLRAGVDIVGIASFRTFLENTSAYRRDLRRAEYGDERDPKMRAVFERIDPVNNADRIRSALLVAHGKNDPRVPFSEAEQIVAKVRSGGRRVWTVYAENEGHGFAKKANRDYLTAVIALFLQEHLLGK